MHVHADPDVFWSSTQSAPMMPHLLPRAITHTVPNADGALAGSALAAALSKAG
jgi:hypothetical protein